MASNTSAAATWRVVGASVCGTAHEKRGRVCDDVHRTRQFANGTLIAAVADGAGSAERAVEGAEQAVMAAVDAAAGYFMQFGLPPVGEEAQWRVALYAALQAARTAIETTRRGVLNRGRGTPSSPVEAAVQVARPAPSEDPAPADPPSLDAPAAGGPPTTPHGEGARTPEPASELHVCATVPERELPLRAFATTLLFAVVTPACVAAIQVGDGAIVMQRDDGTVQAVTWPKHGEYVNETDFITHATFLQQAQFVLLPVVPRAVALFTDGLEPLALNYAAHVPHAPFFRKIFQWAEQAEADRDRKQGELVAFLRSGEVCERTDDDKTLVLAVRV